MKRIVCFLLALIMVMGLIPNTVVTANAYSQWSTTDTAINVMLNAKFYEKPTGGLLGYSTPATPEDQAKYASGISQEAAVTLLRNYVKNTLDKEINNYVKSKNIDLTIGQHNAVALHMFRNKGIWDSDLKTAVTSRKTGNEMVAAFLATHTPYDVSNVESLKTKLDLALCEAGLYLNGLYSMSGLSYALLDNNGDEAADAVVAYVSATGYNLDSTGSLGWYVFDGTKDGTIKGSPIASLTGDHNGKLIVKKASSNTAAEYTINASSMINLNVYKDNKTDIKGTLANYAVFKVSKEEMVGSIKWIYGTGTDTKGAAIKGWINLGEHAVIEEDLKPIATAVLKSAQNVHEGATENSGPTTPAKTLPAGVSFNIYEIKTEGTPTGNKKWGKVIVDGVIGWIDLAYATVDETLGESGSAIGKSGTVTGADEVNIRSSAAIIETPTSNKITALKKGTKVTILWQNAEGTWAKVKWDTPSNGYTQGYIYMHYVQMDNVPQVDTGASSGSLGTVKYTGVVNSNINLNVRQYADVYAAKVDSLPYGTKVNIYATATSRNMKWGMIGQNQWICLTYVNLTEVAQPEAGAGTGSTSTYVQGTVKPATLDVYKNYNANSQKVGTLKKGDVVTILERNTENTSSGTRIWGRIKVGEMEGWINLAYAEVKTVTSVGGTTSGTTSGAASNAGGAAGTVANCISVNVRSAAGVHNAQITKLNNGTSVKVFERVTKDGAPWARITWNNGANEGWVCMNYVTMNTQAGGTAADGTIGGTNSNTISATGIVNSNIDLKVRSGAGLGNAQIGALKKGTKVTVYEQVSADGMIWGRTPYGAGSGWICMSYVTIESTTSTGKGVMGTVARCFAAVNVRSAPGTNNALINKINVGSRVEVFETKQHGTQLWGRVAQGWVCMDYILLDSELPPGTILDATVPTTEATQPGETTEPDDGLNLEGAVSCSISGTVVKADGLKIYNDADDESQEVGKINANKAVTIVGVKKNGTEIWGLINQNGTQGWINLDGGSCKFEGWVNTNKQPVYVSATTSSGVIGELAANVKVEMTKLGTDGSQVYGWIEAESAWIPVSKLNATKPEINTYYSDVGTAVVTTAKTTAEITAYKASNSSEAAFKIGNGYNVGITALDFVGTQVWGKVVIDATTEGWINMNIGNYFTLSVTSGSEMAVYSTKFDKSKPLTVKNAANEDVEVKLPAATTVTVRTLEFDNDGNVWVEVLKSGDVIHNNYIIIRDGDGTPLVSGLG